MWNLMTRDQNIVSLYDACEITYNSFSGLVQRCQALLKAPETKPIGSWVQICGETLSVNFIQKT